MKKQFLFLLLLSVIFSTAQINVTVGPYLQSPTSTSIKVKWRTDSLCTGKIMYGTSPGNLNLSAVEISDTTKHTVKLTGLSPYTRYYYAVYNGNTFAEGGDNDHTFKTFPTEGSIVPIRAWAIGDFGKGNNKQQLVRDAYWNRNEETDFWIWLGDNAYSDGKEEEYLNKVFDTVYGYKKIMKKYAFEPTPGNHDYNSVSPVASPKPPLQHTGPYYDFIDVYTQGEAGGVPSGNQLYYSFNYGNVHFVSLNSEIGSAFTAADDWIGVSPFNTFNGSPFTQWLEQDLAANTLPWTVVYFHQPPYTDGSHGSGAFWEIYMKAMRENICKIWEQHGVDLVLSGHSHVFERSYLVKGSYGDPSQINFLNFVQNTNGIDSLGQAFLKYTQGANPNQGTVYVVNGNSGSSESSATLQHPYMFYGSGCDTCIGSFILDIDSNRLDGRYLDGYGVIRDHFTIKKINAVDPNAIKEVSENSLVDNLKIYPNPFSNSTYVEFNLKKTQNIHIRIFDAVGKLIEVYNGTMQQGKQKIELNTTSLKLAKGIYSLQISSGVESISRKLIIQ